MTDAKIFTYDPFPHGGEITGRNWFNANQISCESEPGGSGMWDRNDHYEERWRTFHKIEDSKFFQDAMPPMLTYGKVYEAKGKFMGTRWTMNETDPPYQGDSNLDDYYEGIRWPERVLSAEDAAKAIAGPVLSKSNGWTQKDKGFMIDYYGYHPANKKYHQKYCWELYNSSNERLSLPVKGVSFLIRHPSEDEMFAVDEFANVNNSDKSRAEQVSINKMWGLWFHPASSKYHCYEMTINGNRHAPSTDLDIEGTHWYQDYWFADHGQDIYGNSTHIEKNNGRLFYISAWSNEKIIEECQFCGFVVDNVVDHAATKRSPHTYQMGQLSPIPFHIDRTGKFKAVYGGFSNSYMSDGLRSIYTE